MPYFNDKEAKEKVERLQQHEEEDFVSAMAPKYGYGYVNLFDKIIDIEALRLLTEEDSRKAEVAVFALFGKHASVALRNPNNPEVVEVLNKLTKEGYELELFMASLRSLEHIWERYADVKKAVAETRGVLDLDIASVKEFSSNIHSRLDVAAKLAEVEREQGAQRVTRTIEAIFGGALALDASDIHIEPEASVVRIRYRLDGVLWDISGVSKDMQQLLISRLKLLSGLKLNIHSTAQDGRFTFDIGVREVEVRSSLIPGGFGESMVMRLLDPDSSSFQIDRLGLNARLFEVIQKELARPNGAIITTGPTGSGKTTALYAFLKAVHTPEVKIITLEDPIEYKLPGIVQTQIGGNYSFASGLRSILRQDPDVIMVGEIRDREVAETSVHAALTGHLVFSTLHTNSAVGAFPRLIDLGVDPRMIGSAFNIILGQRLVRILCEQCKAARDATTEEQKLIARIMEQPVALHKIYDAKGCEQCAMSGFKGRVGVFEAIQVDKAVEKAVVEGGSEAEILDAAKPQGIPSMQQDGIMKALAGITSLDEVSRVLDLYNKRIGSDELVGQGG